MEATPSISASLISFSEMCDRMSEMTKKTALILSTYPEEEQAQVLLGLLEPHISKILTDDTMQKFIMWFMDLSQSTRISITIDGRTISFEKKDGTLVIE
ncbi:MAG: hypothetical protein UT35_C0028G0005 [Candidatus Yanofskybacteria bacterium GW2011_GWD1_39_16]|uniref:Uncharacterized protein n=1 Tax=Candidatus Yanofskybacteria bacterium GW2011_GWD1_39_16 TaxID=1619030 RepID=A0A837HS28_9BACT|nr:MAG: hypothetical protein UT35_C0028G0005 [Candidatus Yanofskybacteria bacterium GW2011_GWD1_39_16]